MQEKPQISILSPIYNEEAHLCEMMDSVRDQLFTSWELILVDDASTDDSLRMAKAAAREDPRIKVISGMGKLGKTQAFNEAYENSTGNYIILLGGDDRLPRNSLQHRYNVISTSKHQKACAYFRLVTTSSNENMDGVIIPKKKKGNRSGGTFIISRSLAEELFPIPSSFVAEDVWLAEMVTLKSEHIQDSAEIVLEYRIHPGNSNPRDRPFKEMSQEMNERSKPLQYILDNEKNLPEDYRKVLLGRLRTEQYRFAGNLLGVMTVRNTSMIDRIRAASMSKEFLFDLRKRFFKAFSGWS